MTRRLEEDGYEMVVGWGKQLVEVEDDFTCCPECKSKQLYMGTTPEVVKNTHSVVIKLTCNECSTESKLALFNAHVGLDKLVTRINWVEKVVPYVEDAVGELKSFSLTGKSKKIKRHVEKHDLGYLKLDEELPKGVLSYRSEDYDEDKNDNIISIRREE